MFRKRWLVIWTYIQCIWVLDSSESCDEAYSCKDLDINLTDSSDGCYCRGFKSCINSTIDVPDQIICYGSGACIGSKSLLGSEDGVWCSGYGSCVDSIVASDNPISNCRAKYGCAAMNRLNYPRCHGELSCAFSLIYNDKYSFYDTIEGYGAVSLVGSIIYSNGDSLTIELYGYYSGFNTTVYCENGDTCTIDCKANGIVNCDYSYECPNGYIVDGSGSVVDETNERYNYYNLIDDALLNVDKLHNNYDIIKVFKMIYNYSYDYNYNYMAKYIKLQIENKMKNCSIIGYDYNEFRYMTLTSQKDGVVSNYNSSDDNICCMAQKSCAQGSITLTDDNYTKNLYCDGASGCASSNITIVISWWKYWCSV